MLCGLAYRASTVKYPDLSALMHDKHTVNMAQVYAFGYQQRHPEWTASPWLECYSLMEETFGNRIADAPGDDPRQPAGGLGTLRVEPVAHTQRVATAIVQPRGGVGHPRLRLECA